MPHRVRLAGCEVRAATGDYGKDLAALQQLWSEREQFAAVVRQLTDIAAGRQLYSRSTFMNERPEHRDQRPAFLPRLFGRAVDLAASTYQRSVSRESSMRGAWERLLWTPDDGLPLDVAMAEADQAALLGGAALIVLRPVMNDGKLERIQQFVIPADRWVGLHDPRDPSKLAAVYALWADNRLPRISELFSTSEPIDPTFIYLDSTWIINGKGPAVAHGNGVLPAVVFPNSLHTMRIDADPIGGLDLVATIRTLHMTFEQVLYAALLSRGQLVVYGDAKRVSAMGPDAPMELDQDDRAETLRQNADLQGMLAVYQTALNTLCASWSLPPNFFNVVSQQPPNSAAVLQVSSAQLESYLLQRQKTIKTVERRLHRTASVIAASADVQLDPDVRTEYPVAPMVLTPAEKQAELALSLDRGLISRRIAAVSLRPHLPPAVVIGGVAAAEAERERDTELAAFVAGRTQGISNGRDDQPTGGAADDEPDDAASRDSADEPTDPRS